MKKNWRYLLSLCVAILMVASACGGSDTDAADGDEAADEGSEEAAEDESEEETDDSSEKEEADEDASDEGAEEASGDPIIIGAATDASGIMAPIDGPAIAAAQLTIDRINAEGGVGGRQIEMITADTTNDPEVAKQVAIDLLAQGAEILLVTCDVDFATPTIEEGLDAGVLTIAPCIGTDQMGPSRFGEPGRLAFSFGNVAQDEGAAMAEWAWDQGFESAVVVPDNLLVYFQDACAAFENRYEELGGEIVATESFTSGDGSVNNVATAVSSAGDVDVISMCTFFPDIGPAVSSIRDLGIDTPIVSPWSGDGNYWSPEDLSGFTYSTYASVFGDDPSADVQALIDELTDSGAAPATGGFLAGAGVIETLAAGIEETGTTNGATLADWLEGLDGLPTIAGDISFSPDLHTVSGREYRFMTFESGTPVFSELRAATSPAEIG